MVASRTAVVQRLVKKTNQPTNQNSKELFQCKHELNSKVLAGLSHWELGLGGELGVTEEIWGPQKEAPSHPTMDPIPHDDPKWR